MKNKEDEIIEEISILDQLVTGLKRVLNKIYLVILILVIVLNLMICFVLTYYGNVLAFLFVLNVYYIVKYHRKAKKERIERELG